MATCLCDLLPGSVGLQASKKSRATRKEIFKRAEQYVKEYRLQVARGGRGRGRPPAAKQALHAALRGAEAAQPAS